MELVPKGEISINNYKQLINQGAEGPYFLKIDVKIQEKHVALVN